MNLHGIVRGAITAVNPDTICTWQQSTGYRYTNDGTGRQIPTFNTVFDVRAQVQGLSSPDLQHAERMNLQGLLRKVYVYGSINGVVRAEFMGGDLLVFNDGNPAPIWTATLEGTPVLNKDGTAVLDSRGQPVMGTPIIAVGTRPLLDSNGRTVFAMSARVWKVTQVSERYPDASANGWTGAIITMQTDQPPKFVTDSSGKYVLDTYGQLVQVGQPLPIQPLEAA